MWSRKELARDFRALGVVEGDVVLLHASVRSVGEVAGGPDQIHLAVRDAVGAAGTLIMYAGCASYYDDVGRGILSAEQEREVIEKHPPFNPLEARSARSHGILVEFFRTFPGTLVNNHVARFAAAGERAAHLIADHPWNFPYGAGSPLDRFRLLGGRIMLLGSDLDAVTFLHHVEHMIEFPGKRISRYKVPYDIEGHVVWREVNEVNTADDGAHANWPERFFAQIVDGYLSRTGNSGSRVGNATAYLIAAQDLYDFAAPILRSTASAHGPVFDPT